MEWTLHEGDAVAWLRSLPSESADAVVTDPPYPEIDRPYGRMTEKEWTEMMHSVVHEIRRVLKPTGSAVFILQPNSEHVGKMRPWLWEFMAWSCREWNMIQDAWWWNPSAPPTVHCQRTHGLMRPSVKACVWLGNPECYRNQGAVLWTQSDAMSALSREDRAKRKSPSGQSMQRSRIGSTVDDRGGVTPFNLLPISNTNSTDSGGSNGHGAATPADLCSWWIRYICPPDGLVLDPFTGSGTVGMEAIREGMSFAGSERDHEYVQMAQERIGSVPQQLTLMKHMQGSPS
jgi:DNA modification methylase